MFNKINKIGILVCSIIVGIGVLGFKQNCFATQTEVYVLSPDYSNPGTTKPKVLAKMICDEHTRVQAVIEQLKGTFGIDYILMGNGQWLHPECPVNFYNLLENNRNFIFALEPRTPITLRQMARLSSYSLDIFNKPSRSLCLYAGSNHILNSQLFETKARRLVKMREMPSAVSCAISRQFVDHRRRFVSTEKDFFFYDNADKPIVRISAKGNRTMNTTMTPIYISTITSTEESAASDEQLSEPLPILWD